MDLEKFIEKFAIKPNMPFERVMVFVDGAYLRRRCKDFYQHDNIAWAKLSWTFIRMFNTASNNPFNANLIRIYYYDGKPPEEDPNFKNAMKYFEEIERQYAYTVRLGKKVKDSDGEYRQKGVDMLMGIDATLMAFQNQYDTGMFLLADADFKPLIDKVKHAGKKTVGIYYKPNCPKDLANSFDWRIWLEKKNFRAFLDAKP